MRIPLIAMGLLLGAASVATGQTVRGVYLRAGDTRFTNDLGRAPTAESASSLSDMEKLARGFITVRSGEDLDPASASRDVRAIQKSGRFSYAEVKTETVPGGVNLLYVVEPMTRIRRLSVDGADELGNKRVRELLELGVGDLVDDALLSARAAKVREEYRKKYFPEARLTWKITPDAGSGTANVEIKVEEGRRSYVRHIKFEGNKAVSAGSLRKAMAQKERIWWWSWISGRGTYKPEDLSADVEILRRLYLDRGHLDASIGEPKLVRSGDLIDVTIPVREGVVYRLGDSRIEGAQALSADQISKAVTNLPGSVLSVAALERTQQAIEDVYATHGYLGSRAAYEIIPHGSGTVVDVRYRVREGEPAKIGDIHIRGNTRTKDEVIRRELTVYPSEIYNSVKVRNSERRLQNLGYFDFVSAVPDETDSPSLYDVLVSVEEARTGNLMFGVGYSSIDNLIGFVEVTQGNFDLFNWPPTGGGQKLKLRGTVGTQRQDMELSFVEPWFLDRKLSLGIDVYQRDSRFLSDKYEQLNTGAALTLGRPLDNFTRLNLTYGLEEIEVTKVDPSASQQIKDEEGAQLKSYLQLQLVRDSRDSSFVATRGNRTMLSATVAGGPLGGDTEI